MINTREVRIKNAEASEPHNVLNNATAENDVDTAAEAVGEPETKIHDTFDLKNIIEVRDPTAKSENKSEDT